MTRRGIGVLALALALALVPGRAALAQTAHPFKVVTASLAQQGQLLVWSVRLDHSFTTDGLKRAHRSLCLLIERSHMVCVKPPTRNGRPPRLAYQRVTAHSRGAAHFIAAQIHRSSYVQLTASFAPSAIHVRYRSIRWQVLSALGPRACVAPTPCVSIFPAKPKLLKLHAPRLVGCVASGAPIVYRGPSTRREIALTFDDGPWPDTPQFLDILERYHVPATFFQIGRQVGTYGRGVDRRMLADGDMIGDHTWDHADVAGDGSSGASEISRAATAIRQMTGFQPCLFRAPGGAVSSALISEAREMGYTTIQWDIDPRDWARPGAGAIYQNVVGNAHNGAIVLQHDGGGDRSQTLAALPGEISTLKARGYRFVTMTQMLGQRLLYK